MKVQHCILASLITLLHRMRLSIPGESDTE